MTYRKDPLTPGLIYHVYNRGVEKRLIFMSEHDYQRFLALMVHCLPRRHITSYSVARKLKATSSRKIMPPEAGQGLVDLIAYCLMPNHFHLLLLENTQGGISKYLQRLTNSYAKYFNEQHDRTGALFAGRFQATRIEGDEHFLHTTRYVHLNAYVAELTKDPLAYRWSSLAEYLPGATKGICHTSHLKAIITPRQYQAFVTEHADYAREMHKLKDIVTR